MTHSASPTSPGSRPPGAADEAEAARYVHRLFSNVAGRYDLLNHLLSLNMDRYWRWATARQFRHVLSRPGARVLDLCCGTADLTLALARRGEARVVSSDFCHPMLTRAQEKLRRSSSPPLLAEADALRLPFRDESFDLVACSFGFRNLANYHFGLREIRRVLKAGGEVGILEFGTPNGRWMGPLYSFYFHRVLPVIGEWISGVPGSYGYLPGSVERFPDPEEFLKWVREAGFRDANLRRLTGGIAVLYAGKKLRG
ncbi:MAG: hypothetical protein A3J28_00300 [Acidobacteria bacterium RIFCSPLOWO2_12_FULL_60_22]|nr:MAG: hypothetical protein A3J28_00300 [Acidobacteria bacterium RIFCSPLOWO2_12_FULL_60_22]